MLGGRGAGKHGAQSDQPRLGLIRLPRGSLSLVRRHGTEQALGVKIGRSLFYVAAGALHFWRDGLHRFWTLGAVDKGV